MNISEKLKQKIKEHGQSLDDASIKWIDGDQNSMNEHFSRYPPGIPIPKGMAFIGAMMKTITARTSITLAVRSKAKTWLLDHEFQLLDDGDVPVNKIGE